MVQLSGFVNRPDGARLRFQVRGARGAPRLVLLQGQANHHGWWNPIRPAFLDTFCTLTFDYRGTGDSTVATGSGAADQWSTTSFADDVAAVMTAVGWQRAHVYGTSMGGRIAQHLAAERPERVDRLVLACTSPGGAVATDRSTRVRSLLAAPDPDARRRATLDLFYRPGWITAHGGHDRAPRDLLGDPSMSRDARAGHLRTSARHDASGVLHAITSPTLVLHGGDDEMTPATNAHVLARMIPGAAVEIVDEGRHGFFHEMSDAVTPRVIEHILG